MTVIEKVEIRPSQHGAALIVIVASDVEFSIAIGDLSHGDRPALPSRGGATLVLSLDRATVLRDELAAIIAKAKQANDTGGS